MCGWHLCCFRRSVLLFLCALAACSGCSHRVLAPKQTISLDRVPIQYNYSRTHTTFAIDDEQWSQVQQLFDAAKASPRDERCAIQQAVLHISIIAGTQTPTHRNLGRNRFSPRGDGDMDCRDEANNTTTYLTLLHQHGLLHWHDVMQPAFRGPLHLDSHNSALIRDRQSGELFVVDPWYLDHGNPPRIQLLEQWLTKQPAPDMVP